jgi:hypothetical protein
MSLHSGPLNTEGRSLETMLGRARTGDSWMAGGDGDDMGLRCLWGEWSRLGGGEGLLRREGDFLWFEWGRFRGGDGRLRGEGDRLQGEGDCFRGGDEWGLFGGGVGRLRGEGVCLWDE